ncbi:hypothetical protein GCM10010967_54410 [Dyadobacter beijingensis]|uniref:DUF5683 domain-containing protein n=1 Tax=Dyadobacter beijingensis TaxID=365489 RepID=A0ABQ2IHG9_9BACT|nr:hypothetical protein [Dyadobacter beijingensis]GGN11592.1 hypothetical protein GCM10010967_54410 [Dyadobacter beijingensis]
MRKVVAVSFLVGIITLLLSPAANAQDKIIQKDGKEIKGKVLGTDSKYVKYKRADNPDGPDYFIFRSEVVRIEYENGRTELKLGLQKPRENAPATPDGLKYLEQKINRYQKRSTIYLAVGSAAILGGAATLIKLNSDFNTYKRGIRQTNDAYIAWYKANYDQSPPAADLQKQENFLRFASPGIYAGAAAVLGGIALDLIGLKNVHLTKKTRTELAQKKEVLSFRPYYDAPAQAGGLSIALSF